MLRSLHVPQRARLIWSVHKQGLVEGMVPEISQLSKSTSVSVFEGKRMDIAAVLGEGLTGKRENGPVGVVVCGPPGMADEVRARISLGGVEHVGNPLCSWMRLLAGEGPWPLETGYTLSDIDPRVIEFGYIFCSVPQYLRGVLSTGLAEVSIVMLLSRGL